jgi:tRNA(Ile)-lysidine synthase
MNRRRGLPPLDPSSTLLTAVRTAVAGVASIPPGARVLVAVSGGPDSVALFHALSALAPEQGWRLCACHVHHGLRLEADDDGRFVERLASDLGWPVTVDRVVVPSGAGLSPEASARAARYAALGRAARAFAADRVALGHTADDQAETVLMRLLQGAGPRGLSGIPPRRGRLVRPLLLVPRATVLGYLAANGLRWVEDATNRDPKFLRNRIRADVLPLLGAHVGPTLGRALGRTASAARETVEALDRLVAPRLDGRLRPTVGGVTLDLEALRDLPPGAGKALLQRAVAAVAPPGPLRSGLRAGPLAGLWDLSRTGSTGARVRLTGGVVAERLRGGVWIGRQFPAGNPVDLAVPGEVRLAGARLVLTADVVPAPAGRSADHAWPDPAWEVWFDQDALSGGLVVRTRRPGERVVPFGGTGPISMSRLLAAAGVPRLLRPTWPVLVTRTVAAEEIVWVIGVRRATMAPVTGASRAMVCVRAASAVEDVRSLNEFWTD